MYNQHVKEHSDKVHKCYQCSEQFDNARVLRKHIKSHINQCPICSRVFESLLVLSNHMNKEHVDALEKNQKKCPFCDAAFATFDELSIHCKEHRSFSCDICYTGFVSEPLLVEHCFSDHPQGRPPWSTSRADPEITITKEVDPDLERVMEVIRTPDPDHNKKHFTLGIISSDSSEEIFPRRTSTKKNVCGLQKTQHDSTRGTEHDRRKRLYLSSTLTKD